MIILNWIFSHFALPSGSVFMLSAATLCGFPSSTYVKDRRQEAFSFRCTQSDKTCNFWFGFLWLQHHPLWNTWLVLKSTYTDPANTNLLKSQWRDHSSSFVIVICIYLNCLHIAVCPFLFYCYVKSLIFFILKVLSEYFNTFQLLLLFLPGKDWLTINVVAQITIKTLSS